MKKKRKNIFYNCKQASFLMTKSVFGKVQKWAYLQMKIHLSRCSACKIYLKQMQTIEDTFGEMQQNFEAHITDISLTQEQKIALENVIKNAI